MTEQERTVLPPISTLTAGMPPITLDFFRIPPPTIAVHIPPPLPPPQPREEPIIKPQPERPPLRGKQMTFTALEDISILKAMRVYLGKNVSFKIPWSFWQIYRRSTGSQRSDSSLYHHWNGAMTKKYNKFIKEGKIDECIKWAEKALDVESTKTVDSEEPESYEKRALIHTSSMNSVPTDFFRLKTEQITEDKQKRQLTHFKSLQNCATYSDC